MRKYLSLLFLLFMAMSSCTFEEDNEKLLEIEGNKKQLIFEESGGLSSITIKSGTKWQVSKQPQWLSVESVDQGADPFEWIVRFKCEENDGDYRSDSVIIRTAFAEIGFQVAQSATKTIAVKSVEVYPTTLDLELKKSDRLSAIVHPDDATNKEVKWTSSNPEVVFVDKEGNVTALSGGNPVTITVTSVDGGKKASCRVTVIVPVTSILLTQEETMVEGDSKTLSATVYPLNATDPSISWDSSRPKVVRVHQNGAIEALSVGTAIITATSKSNPSVSAQCAVTVSAKHISVESLSLSSQTLNLKAGAEQTVRLTVSPLNATNKSIRYSDPSVKGVAEILDNLDGTYTVYALMKGTTAFTFTSVDSPQATALLTVNVTLEYKTPVPVDLGLPSNLLWADFNLGAKKDSDPGFYYSWGETEPKLSYTWNNYSLCKGSFRTLTKYCTDTSFGSKDDNTWLDAVDDAAASNLGGKWRMPTEEEVAELFNNCKCDPISRDGILGYLLTGRTGKSIFLPAVGYYGNDRLYSNGISYYLTSTLRRDNPAYARYLSINSGVTSINDVERANGVPVRPVYGDRKVAVTNISVVPESLYLKVGSTVKVKVTITPSNATDQSYYYSVSDPGIANVINNSNKEVTITGYLPGTTDIIFASSSNDDVKAVLKVNVTKDYVQPVAVDLGLPSGVKWASFNLGAASPSECGDYFAWGETAPKTKYFWNNYLFTSKGDTYDTVQFSKYNNADSKKVLDSRDDAAKALLGDSWRMPTIDDFEELRANCTISWPNQGVAKITSKKNGASIYMPAAGYSIEGKNASDGLRGMYWLNSVYGSDSRKARLFSLTLSSTSASTDIMSRYCGLSIRPVSGTPIVRVTGVEVSPKSIILAEKETTILSAKVSPSNAAEKTFTWKSEDSSIATVDKNGKVTAKKEGSTRIIATTTDGGFSDFCTVIVSAPFKAIDMGLPSGTKWANMNLGASRVTDYGDYYAWGEVRVKPQYGWENYMWGNESSLTKYNNNPDYGDNNEADYRLQLELGDDAAHVSLLGDWCMPTQDDIIELWTNCSHKWDPDGKGMRMTSKKNGNSVFFPATGYIEMGERKNQGVFGTYWTSTLKKDDPRSAQMLEVTYGGTFVYSFGARCSGRSIRPILPPHSRDIPVTGLALNPSSISIEIGRQYQLIATVIPTNATDKYVKWTSSNEAVATVDQTGLVKGLSRGATTISAVTRNGQFNRTCSVTVSDGHSLSLLYDIGINP